MTYNGKQVYTPDTFNYSKVRVGDYVTEEVVDDAMDCLPPACMTSELCQQILLALQKIFLATVIKIADTADTGANPLRVYYVSRRT
mgnify:CR=1 FL=1